MVINFAIIFLLLVVIVAVVPGTVMGWIAAKKIRESNGALYGMRIAALAALPLPLVLALLVLLLILTLLLRAAFVFDHSGSADMLVIPPVLATGLILLIKWFATLLSSLNKGEPIMAGFLSRMNRITVITLVLIWLVFGGLFAASLIRTEVPPLDPPASIAKASEGGLRFQPEHKLTIPRPYNGSRTSFLDMDTRRFVEGASIHSLASQRFNSADSKPLETDLKIEEWASGLGADLIIFQNKEKVMAALYGGPTAYQSTLDFDSATPTQVLEAAKNLPETPLADEDQPHITLFGPESREPIVFRTREGSVGLLELRIRPDSLKGGLIVRYKTIREAP